MWWRLRLDRGMSKMGLVLRLGIEIGYCWYRMWLILRVRELVLRVEKVLVV